MLLYIQSVLILCCFICKVSLFCAALYAKHGVCRAARAGEAALGQHGGEGAVQHGLQREEPAHARQAHQHHGVAAAYVQCGAGASQHVVFT